MNKPSTPSAPSTPPPGWEFVPGSTKSCQPTRDLVATVGRVFDAAELMRSPYYEILATPVTLERAHQMHAELVAVLQPR